MLISLALSTLVSCDKIFGPDVGNIKIDSYPDGALIFLNGENTDRQTPYTFKDKESGQYTVRLTLNNYLPYEEKVSVDNDETISIYGSMQKGYGNVSIITTPIGAIIKLGYKTYDEVTPLFLDSIYAGEYNLTLSLEGHESFSKKIYVNMDDTTIVNINLDSILSWIQITSEPTTASIYIDNSITPLTTPTIDSLPPGNYTIRAEANGYHTETKNVTLSAFDTTSIHFDLVLITGGINITSNPSGAFIYLDNLPTGEITPAIISTIPSDHFISVQKAGYYNFDSTIHVIMNDTIDVDFPLSAKPTSIEVKSNPSGAIISINNIATEYTTPHTFENIAPDDYEIRLNLPTYFPVDSLFTAVLGFENHLTFSLTNAPNISFAYTIGDTIFVANLDGINTDTLAVDYDDYISSYISHYGRMLWSPDGNKIAYSGDTKAVSMVTSDGTWINGFNGNRSMDFAWSANSNELAYGYYCGGIYKNILSTNWYGKITGSCYDHSPAYSPSGNKIMYLLNNWGRRGWLYTVNSDGSGRRLIYGRFTTGFDEVINLYWTTDSTAIFKLGGNGVYNVLIPDSGSITVTKPITDGVSQLRLSADRQWCAYNTSAGISIMQVDIWSAQRISSLSVYDFSVLSGGQYIACRTSDGVHFIDNNGNDFHVIIYPNAGRGAIDIKP
ncbi:MAG: PEGA domain-containing protein [Candidatus Kerfeldbacteria bacterium]